MRPRARTEDPRPEINITPLVDVVLVLLIIFMVVTPYLENAVELELPEADHAETADPSDEARSISITRDGRTFLGRDEVSETELLAVVDGHLQGSQSAPILVRADEQVAYRNVRQVFESLRSRGARAVALATDAGGAD
ncbi:ExbD/TolR family protein [Sandaracinus amylolyticus]|uniref:ExbD/TolR family protein n=1 Tax=Sandaracinus amylolyticus TaxID=927083 RepID=UPI001F2F6E5C|nr:biopolymer transporter ExbD [Sandaracinus amylolyticus]UJR86687.1 Hypothetical protein I5071_87880 [Sandaracinus amylolyticus]